MKQAIDIQSCQNPKLCHITSRAYLAPSREIQGLNCSTFRCNATVRIECLSKLHAEVPEENSSLLANRMQQPQYKANQPLELPVAAAAAVEQVSKAIACQSSTGAIRVSRRNNSIRSSSNIDIQVQCQVEKFYRFARREPDVSQSFRFGFVFAFGS